KSKSPVLHSHENKRNGVARGSFHWQRAYEIVLGTVVPKTRKDGQQIEHIVSDSGKRAKPGGRHLNGIRGWAFVRRGIDGSNMVSVGPADVEFTPLCIDDIAGFQYRTGDLSKEREARSRSLDHIGNAGTRRCSPYKSNAIRHLQFGGSRRALSRSES